LITLRLLKFRHKLVEQYCPIEINDANVCRIVSPIVDPSLSIQQCDGCSRCAKGSSSLDYLAGRVHLDYEQRKIGSYDSLLSRLRGLFHSPDRRYLPVMVPNFDIVSIKIPFGGLDCGSVIRAVQRYAIDETAIVIKNVDSVMGQEVTSTW